MSGFPFLGLIFHACKVGGIIHSHGNEAKVKIQRWGTYTVPGLDKRSAEAEAPFAASLLPWGPPSSLGPSTSFAGTLTRGRQLLG